MFIGKETKDIHLEPKEETLLDYKRLSRNLITFAQIFGKKKWFHFFDKNHIYKIQIIFIYKNIYHM